MNTHLSANSKAAVRFEIMRHPHWVLQLRQARLFIYEREQTLAQTYYKQKTAEILQRQLMRKLNNFTQLLNQPGEDPIEIQDEIDLLKIELEKSLSESEALQPLIKDAISELEEARKLEAFIYSKYPESQILTYEEIQDLYSEEILLTVQAKNAAIKVLALQHGVPEALAQTLIDLPENNRLKFLVKMQDNLSIVSNFLQPKAEIESGDISSDSLRLPEENLTNLNNGTDN